MKKHVVTIHNEIYTLRSDESDDMVLRAVTMLNDLMRTISMQTPTADTKKVAVLAALQAVTQLIQLQGQCDMLEQLTSAIDEHIQQS